VPTWIFVSGYLATWTVYGLAVFALGVMRLVWMGIVAALIFTQKVLAFGERLPYAFAPAFVAAGVWIAASPGSVSGLTQPDSPKADQARMRMMHLEQRVPMDRPDSEMEPSDEMSP